MSIESVMPSNQLIFCRSLLLLPSIFPSIRVFSNKSVLLIRWPKYWSLSFNISPSNEHSGLILFRMDWLDLLAVQGTLKSLLQHHSSKASILCHSALFIVQLSHPYMTTGKTIALTRWTGKITWRRPWLPGEYFYLENPMNWGVWQTTVHRITKSWTQLKRLSMHAHGTVSWVLENERRTRLHVLDRATDCGI